MSKAGVNLPDYRSYFSDPELVKAFYIPTDSLKLGDTQRKVAFSPRRIPEKESGEKQPITPETEAYLKQTNNIFNINQRLADHATPSPSSTDKYDESWPASSKENTDNSSPGMENSSITMADISKESVISRYIDRFRFDPPKKREERKVPSLKDFWWKTNPSQGSRLDSTLDSRDELNGSTAASRSIFEKGSEIASDSTPKYKSEAKKTKKIVFEPATPNTKALVDKTNQLLSDSSAMESSPPVSSCVGGISSESSESSSILLTGIKHSTPEEPRRPVLLRNVDAPNRWPGKGQSFSASVSTENDILYQWRLRRRLETAQDKVHQAELKARFNVPTRSEPQYRSPSDSHKEITAVEALSQRNGHLHDEKAAIRKAPVANVSAVEKLVQTEPEKDQTTTQTTPTIDPLAPYDKNSCVKCAFRERNTCKIRHTLTSSLHGCDFNAGTECACNKRSHHRPQLLQNSPDCGLTKCLCGDESYTPNEIKPHEVTESCEQGTLTKSNTDPAMQITLKQLVKSPKKPQSQSFQRKLLEKGGPDRQGSTPAKSTIQEEKAAKDTLTPVSHTIKQIASQRLFFGTPDANSSAVDRDPESTIHSEDPDSRESPTDVSSEEDFADDHILKSLRQQRALLICKLREINKRHA